ncbi:polyketide synthase [Corynebacterium sp. P5848]|uniref:beta-ketoacyl [acyl carrier protein] synthase domain-containing protein n=1 Tax=Corynebacterium marambiense TaxID=2765364 RepID=UPI002260E5B4|nr:polyketide synthase [Corynebacterium marambiense]MCX7541630.1 polyketide synthase [Corynebacterium marambiense]
MTDEPGIVIVGIGLETPGNADSCETFLDIVNSRSDVCGPLPRDRGYDLDLLFSLHERPGWAPVPDRGGFLTGAAEFDPEYFGITPHEARIMDPQQRVGLRVAHRAVEHAGWTPADLAGTDTGCFMGALMSGYGPDMAVPDDYNGHKLVGSSLSAISGRISHHLDLHGPSVTVDTGCGASLTAIHNAAAAIRAGECTVALAGGVTVMGSEMMFVEFSRNQALSTNGLCRPFSADANGTVWGEGAAVLVLCSDSFARAHDLTVHGRILGSAVNHNGRGGPLHAPSEEGQVDVMLRALKSAGTAPRQVGCIEGHGTGTRAGDPIEMAALSRVYGNHEHPVPFGSVKSNMGHPQAAAGAIGLIKLMLGARQGTAPPTIIGSAPAVPVPELGLVPADGQPWRISDGHRIGAVSSFGIGGTNTHLIVAYPAPRGKDQ